MIGEGLTYFDIREGRENSRVSNTHRLTLTVLLLSAACLGSSQIPLGSCTPEPNTPPDGAGYCATRLVIYYYGFPVAWFAGFGLITTWILIVKEKRIVELTEHSREEETSHC